MTEIKASDLRKGVEVDLPVEWKHRPIRQCTIRYEKETNSYIMSDIKTGEIHYRYGRLSNLIKTTNQIYNYKDKAVDD